MDGWERVEWSDEFFRRTGWQGREGRSEVRWGELSRLEPCSRQRSITYSHYSTLVQRDRLKSLRLWDTSALLLASDLLWFGQAWQKQMYCNNLKLLNLTRCILISGHALKDHYFKLFIIVLSCWDKAYNRTFPCLQGMGEQQLDINQLEPIIWRIWTNENASLWNWLIFKCWETFFQLPRRAVRHIQSDRVLTRTSARNKNYWHLRWPSDSGEWRNIIY